MTWTVTFDTTASGSIDGTFAFEDAWLQIEFSACRLESDGNTDRHLAIFNGLGRLVLGDRRFAFDPNRYGLLMECQRQAEGEWLTVAFGTADAPLCRAGFALPHWTGPQGIHQAQGAPDSGMNYQNTLEALESVTLKMATLRLERGNSTPRLSLRHCP